MESIKIYEELIMKYIQMLLNNIQKNGHDVLLTNHDVEILLDYYDNDNYSIYRLRDIILSKNYLIFAVLKSNNPKYYAIKMKEELTIPKRFGTTNECVCCEVKNEYLYNINYNAVFIAKIFPDNSITILLEIYRYDLKEINIHNCELILKSIDKEIYDKAMAMLLLYELKR